MNLSTDTRKKAFKKTMKILGRREVNAANLTKQLCKGEEIYKGTHNAKEFVKDLVDSDYPVERTSNNRISRTDVEVSS